MKTRARTSRWPLPLILAAALLPTMGVALRAVADEPEAPQVKTESPERAKKRVLAAMPGDATLVFVVDILAVN